VWGGWHPSMFSRECLSEQSVDVTVRGQGEETFAEIVGRLAQGRSLDDCAGCTVRLSDGSIQENPARELAQVDNFRAHDYGLIPVERYSDSKVNASSITSPRKAAIFGARSAPTRLYTDASGWV
jgi:anaerobic magnesium-protoporphyrin IX monomethyl ester cyclase